MWDWNAPLDTLLTRWKGYTEIFGKNDQFSVLQSENVLWNRQNGNGPTVVNV